MEHIATDIGDIMTEAVERAAPSILRVSGPRGVGGSGFVWDADGTIVTSYRVVRAACGAIEVASAAGGPIAVEWIGGDRATDVAVLRAEPAGLAPLERAAAAPAKVGQPVLALARPGASVRASLRIVGVRGDDVEIPGGRLEEYLETDRGFPRGFAGGPLVDLQGRGLGLDTPHAIRGADLTVTNATLARVIQGLVDGGAAKRGYLGVGVQRVRLPPDAAAAIGRDTGALVVAVDDGSPAAVAGVLVGDIVTALGGGAVSDVDSLRQELVDKIATRVEVKIVRGGAIRALEVEVGERGPR